MSNVINCLPESWDTKVSLVTWGNLRPWGTKITLFYVPEGAVGKATRHPAPAPELSTGYPQALGAYIARVQGTAVDISQHQALSYPQPHHSPPWTRLKCT